MKKRGTNSKTSRSVYSDTVNKIMGIFNLSNILNAKETMFAKNKLLSKKEATKKDKMIMLGAIGICLILVIVIIIVVIPKNKKVAPEEKKKTIYELTYKDMKFEENKSLRKLECHKNVINENSDLSQEEIKIYYFNEDVIDTYIYHIDIKVTDEYMDYYDAMYKTYDESLKRDYSYDNVDTNLTKGDKELLITVINYNSREGENKLSPEAFINYEDAEKSITDSGYICK